VAANFASALAIELRRSNWPGSRDYLRFKFKNGTADDDFRVIHPLGHEDDVPLTEFLYRLERYQISNNQQWYAACHGGSLDGIAAVGEDTLTMKSNTGLALMGGVFAIVLLIALFSVARTRKALRGRIRLDNTEAGTTPVPQCTNSRY
jgi:lysosomal acid phosphatase